MRIDAPPPSLLHEPPLLSSKVLRGDVHNTGRSGSHLHLHANPPPAKHFGSRREESHGRR